THARRLYILGTLVQGERALSELQITLSLSPEATWLHLRKLANRGFIASRKSGRQLYVRIPDPLPTPLHRKFWEVFVSPPDTPTATK
ncbi:MAG: hypothetical protein ACI8W8_000419, partial [Rhodothermales bacterium]